MDKGLIVGHFFLFNEKTVRSFFSYFKVVLLSGISLYWWLNSLTYFQSSWVFCTNHSCWWQSNEQMVGLSYPWVKRPWINIILGHKINLFNVFYTWFIIGISWGTSFKHTGSWASLVAQWLTICLPMQGTRVRALVREDPTCHGAAGPVSHNYWACASGACAPQQERPR